MVFRPELHMNALAHLVLVAFVPLALVLFACIRARRAMLAVLAGGALFLPILTLDLPGPLSFGKPEAISYALLMGMILFDGSRLAALRFSGWDAAFIVALIAGPMSSVSSGLGLYDALALLLAFSVQVGIPYLMGKMYLSSSEGLRAALWMFVISGVAYAPFCLYEVRMSPQLHAMFYGNAQHSFQQTMRGGGYRPMVFMSHGLALSLWMAAATVSSFALWRTGTKRGPGGIPMVLVVGGLAVTLLLCKSTGAIALSAVAILALMPGCRRWLVGALLLAVPVYLGLRLFGGGFVESVTADTARLVSDERGRSLQFRFDNEARLLDGLWEHPWFGAGRRDFGGFRDLETGEAKAVVADSYWIISTATQGLLGLFGAIGLIWLPAVRALGWSGGSPAWRSPERLAVCILLMVLIMDSMVNSFVTVTYVALAGGLSQISLREPSHAMVGASTSAPARPGDPRATPAATRPRLVAKERAPRPVSPLRVRGDKRG